MTDINPYAPPESEALDVGAGAAWDGVGSLALATFRVAWQGYLDCFPAVFGILALTYLPLDFLTAWYEFHHVSEQDWVALLRITHLQNQWILLVPDGALLWLAWNHVHGRSCSVGECLGIALRRYWPLWWTRFLIGLSYLSFLLLIVPGVYLGTRWFLSEVVVLADGRTGTKAFARSWEVTRGRFWRIFGAALLGSIPLLALMGAATAAWAFLPWQEWWIDGIIEFILSLGMAFFLFFTAVLYHHLREAPPAPTV